MNKILVEHSEGREELKSRCRLRFILRKNIDSTTIHRLLVNGFVHFETLVDLVLNVLFSVSFHIIASKVRVRFLNLGCDHLIDVMLG